jgi:hypothetical protein
MVSFSKTIPDYFKFIRNRHTLYYKKNVLKLPPPWSDIPEIRDFKSCNVYRRLDRGTQYILNRVCLNPDLSEEDKFLNIVAYRFFNLDQVFDGLIWDQPLRVVGFDPVFQRKHLKGLGKKKIFSDAYMIAPGLLPEGETDNAKCLQVLLSLTKCAQELQTGYLDWFKACNAAEDQLEMIRGFPMIGPFLSGQILVDLGYAGVTRFSNNDWLVIGPGAWVGLQILFPNENKMEQRMKQVYLLRDLQQEYLGDAEWRKMAPLGENNYPFLPLMDIQNGLCEFRKNAIITEYLAGRCKRPRLRYWHPTQGESNGT